MGEELFFKTVFLSAIGGSFFVETGPMKSPAQPFLGLLRNASGG